MPLKLQFLVMSSGEDNRILAQLIESLAPWPVLIHQDASRERPPMPSMMRRGVRWARPAVATGWGDWGFASAILHSMAQALREGPFDHLQLLSPSCLPIRPLSDLIVHLGQTRADHQVDSFALERDCDTQMSFGWRAYAPTASERQKLLSRLRTWYFGETPELEQQHSMSVLHRRGQASGWGGWRAATAVALTRALASGRSWPAPGAASGVDRYPDAAPARPATCAVGSVWFGASRAVCERMLTLARSADFQARFQRLTMVDELLIPTLLMYAGHHAEPSNHCVSAFDERGHPRVIDWAQLQKAAASGRFFARKFAPQADDSCRLQALSWAGCDPQSTTTDLRETMGPITRELAAA